MAETAFDKILRSFNRLISRYGSFCGGPQHHRDLKLLRTFVNKLVEKNHQQNEVKILANSINDANQKIANAFISFQRCQTGTYETLPSIIEDVTVISTVVQKICIKLPDIICSPRADTIVVEDETV
ncbi:unnamed protein product, partial [Ilex paraguariensis]